MKKLKFFALGLVGLATAGLTTSCEEDLPDNKPEIDITDPNGSPSVEVGGSVAFRVVCGTNEKLESFVVNKTFAGVTEEIADSTLESGLTSFIFVDTLFTASAEGTVTFSFTITDNKGESSTASVNVNVVQSLSDPVTGIVYNIMGPNEGAWDLVNDEAKAVGDDDADKDLVDETTNAPIWSQSFGSLNGTEFVLDNSIDFDNASITDIAAAYENGTATASTGTLAQGDIFVAKNIRYPQDYVVVRITAVNSTVTDNEDNLEFEYRK